MSSITLLLPVKNGSRFLKSSLTNMIDIAGENDSILIVDDFSEDDSMSIINHFQLIDSRIQVLKNRKPGLVNALNLGVKESHNNWIARCDVDDFYPKDRLEVQKTFVDEGVSGIFTDYEFFADTEKSLGVIPSAIYREAVSISLSKSQRTAHPSIMYSKEAVLSAGGYRKEDFPAEDLSLWLRMSKEGELISVPKVLLKYRLTPMSVSWQKRELIQQKTKNLLLTIGINSKDFINTVNNIESIFLNYDKTNLSSRRKILLLREILDIQRNPSRYGIGGNQNSKVLRNIRFLLKNEFLTEGLILKRERDRREKFRHMGKNEKYI